MPTTVSSFQALRAVLVTGFATGANAELLKKGANKGEIYVILGTGHQRVPAYF